MQALPELTPQLRLGIIGLGYVGLPLAVAFARHFVVTGFDLSQQRIAELVQGHDRAQEVPLERLQRAGNLHLTADPAQLAGCQVFIVTVPTPVDAHKRPDLRALQAASQTVGQVLPLGGVVIYESTVYPGATEEICAPVLATASGLTLNSEFYLGYSPERINPGDPVHRLETIIKITAGSTPAAAAFVDALYQTIIPAGTHRASSLRVAEAAKAIENTQRDVNIALINELALFCHRLGLDTLEVLEAAGTKWNFLPFRPGLVGGHCIGVDPYYLTHKAAALGLHPEIMLAGRRINDSMGYYLAREVLQKLAQRGVCLNQAQVLLLGLTFKENCPDIRNTRVIDVIQELAAYGIRCAVYDPWANAAEAQAEYGLTLLPELCPGDYDALVVAVAHRQFRALGAAALRQLGKPGAILYDVKSVFPLSQVDGRL